MLTKLLNLETFYEMVFFHRKVVTFIYKQNAEKSTVLLDFLSRIDAMNCTNLHEDRKSVHLPMQ